MWTLACIFLFFISLNALCFICIRTNCLCVKRAGLSVLFRCGFFIPWKIHFAHEITTCRSVRLSIIFKLMPIYLSLIWTKDRTTTTKKQATTNREDMHLLAKWPSKFDQRMLLSLAYEPPGQTRNAS